MQIISCNSGAFRLAYRTFRPAEQSLETLVAQIDKQIRTHPYLQRSHDWLSIYIPKIDQEGDVTKECLYVGREVIGPPLMSGDEDLKILDADPAQYLAIQIPYEDDYSLNKLKDKYIQAVDELGHKHLGQYWRVEINWQERIDVQIHLLSEEKNLFSQFTDN